MDDDKIEYDDIELCADSLSNCDNKSIDDDSSDNIIYRSRTTIRLRISSSYDSSLDSDDSVSQEEWYKNFLKLVAVLRLTDEIVPESDPDSEEQIPSTAGIRKKAAKDHPPSRLSMDMKKHVLESIVETGRNKNVLQ
ncbi:hypothetical protein M0804_006984 [Polistes exclamans]|nr:hypothetical protein M0804_006984 [Polistes exclamans]